MKYLALCLLSVSLLLAAVSENLEFGEFEQFRSSSNPVISNSQEGPTSGASYESPIDRALGHVEENTSTWPSYDWWDDIEIYPGRVGSGQDFDVCEDTGDLYAVFDTNNNGTTTPDSIIVYRSQDNGMNWSFYACESSTFGQINNPKIRVVKDGSGNTWVVIMGIWTDVGSSDEDEPWTRRYPVAGGTPVWDQISTDDVSCADMDADVGSGAYVYVTYTRKGTETIRAARNLLDGGGWVDDENIYYSTGITDNLAAIAAGANGTVSVAMIIDTPSDVPSLRIKRSMNYGASWSSSEQVEPSGSWDDLEDIDIAFTRSALPQTAWITVTFIFSTSDNFGYFLSTDSGQSWSWEALFSMGDDENHGTIRARKTDGSLTVAYNTDPGDSTMFSWTIASSPTSFSTPIRINEFNATGNWPATAGWNGSNNSAIIYANYSNNYRLMYDSYNHTGIEGGAPAGLNMISNAPNPFNATTNISFTLTQNSPVTIAVYNVAGQLVNTIADNQSFTEGSHSVQWNAQSLSPGVYFCRLNADGIDQTHRMLLVK